MQVNDSQAPPPSTASGKQPISDDGPARARARSGPRFRRALERTRSDAPADSANDGASAAALAGWFRAESLPGTSKATGVERVAAARPVDRVLIGSGPDGAHARIRIGAGALAGTEIQVSSVSGRTVEAQLLTHAASSRQTLSVVMDEIRSRLQHKGIALSTRGAAGRPLAPATAVDGVDQGAAGGRCPEPPPGSGR
jgi:hypothetical protein